ncbi:MAG: hypothetical protein VB024_10705 [Dysgonamonadaceae bacterium]|nr:hypothetical protein [Dysgonamonadaceae bacterium]
MSKQINTEQYIQGFYIPKLAKLSDEIMKVLDISVSVYIKPLRIIYANEIGRAEKQGDQYIIYILPDFLRKDRISDDVISLFIHELWHIRQMIDNRLNINSAQTVAIWEGIHYPMTIKYENRPWEIEAKEMELQYLEQIKAQI